MNMHRMDNSSLHRQFLRCLVALQSIKTELEHQISSGPSQARQL